MDSWQMMESLRVRYCCLSHSHGEQVARQLPFMGCSTVLAGRCRRFGGTYRIHAYGTKLLPTVGICQTARCYSQKVSLISTARHERQQDGRAFGA
jgi:hypothetical protein